VAACIKDIADGAAESLAIVEGADAETKAVLALSFPTKVRVL